MLQDKSTQIDSDHASRRLSAIVQSSSDAIISKNLDGIIQSWNAAAERIFGYAGDEIVGKSILTLIPEERQHEEEMILGKVRKGERLDHYETVRQRKDGSLIDVSITVSPIFDEDGNVVGASKIARDVTERHRAEALARHFVAIVESSEDTIISKDLNGIIQSWNKAAERMFGYTAEEIIGKPVLTLISPDRYHEEDNILARIRSGDRVEHFETVRRRKDGSLVDISLTVSPIRDDKGNIVGASKIARDITERKRAERHLQVQTQRLETLNRVAREISRDLDLERVVQTATDVATQLSGAEFGAFFYNVLDERGESYMLYTLSGVPRSAFEKFPMPRNTAVFGPTFRGEGVVRSDDIRKDPRYGKNDPYYGMPKGHLPVVSYLAVPVISAGGDVLGGLFFGHSQPGIFNEDVETLISAIASQTAVAMDNARLHRAAQIEIEERKRAEAGRELLLHEIKHRVKNTLATVQAMAAQTFREAPPSERGAFVERLQALATAHDLLIQKNWVPTNVKETIDRAIAPFRDGREERVTTEGLDVELPPNKALLVAMFLHELGTNAVKYGALSKLSGKVELCWREEHGADGPVLLLEWRESGGPPVMPPTRQGFGTRMIERALRGEGGSATFDFLPSGLACTMRIAIEQSAIDRR